MTVIVIRRFTDAVSLGHSSATAPRGNSIPQVSRFPDLLRGASDQPAFVRRPEYYFVRGAARSSPADAVAILHETSAGRLLVLRGRPPRRGDADAGPVYSAGPDGPLAVPTGLVFVRLTAGLTPADRRAELAAAGFEIERTVAYAPEAAWLRPASGGVARALEGLDDLARVPGVAHVEPQMLMARATRER